MRPNEKDYRPNEEDYEAVRRLRRKENEEQTGVALAKNTLVAWLNRVEILEKENNQLWDELRNQMAAVAVFESLGEENNQLWDKLRNQIASLKSLNQFAEKETNQLWDELNTKVQIASLARENGER